MERQSGARWRDVLPASSADRAGRPCHIAPTEPFAIPPLVLPDKPSPAPLGA